MNLNKEILDNIFQKVSTPRPIATFFVTGIFSYAIIALFANFSLVLSYLYPLDVSSFFSIVWSLITGYHRASETYIVLTNILTAVLIGLNFTLLTELMSSKSLTGSITGTLLGLTFSGCAACATGVITIAGASIGLGFMPYNGFEFNLLSIGLLTYTALYISAKDIQNKSQI